MNISVVAPWLAAMTGLLAFLTAALGVYKSTRNSSAIQALEIKVDGRLTELLQQTQAVAKKSEEVAHLLGREEMRKETDETAIELAKKTIAATLDATRETPVAVDIVSSIDLPIAAEKDPK